MPRGARVKGESGIYHIVLRGANRQEIFHDDDDCYLFMGIFERYQRRSSLGVLGWCLMNNHVHLLVKEGNEGISDTIKRICVSFVWHYNEKYKTSGHLFQDRFRSENVDTRLYLMRAIRYIHQNPVKAGMVEQAGDWRWSSCLGYYGRSPAERNLLDCEPVLRIFSDDLLVARERFEVFNERENNNKCLDFHPRKNKLSDDEARVEIKKVLGATEIAQVKSLPRWERNEVLRRVKGIKGCSQRQIARIFGVSPNLIHKAWELGEEQ